MLGLELQGRGPCAVEERLLRVLILAEDALDVLRERRERLACCGVQLIARGELRAQAFQISDEQFFRHGEYDFDDPIGRGTSYRISGPQGGDDGAPARRAAQR